MKKKPDPKPLFALKHDFVESLNHFTQEVLALRQALELALRHELIEEPAKTILTEQLAKLSKAADGYTEHDNDEVKESPGLG